VIGDEENLLIDDQGVTTAQSGLQRPNPATPSTPEVDREQPQINPPDSNQGGKVDAVPLSLSRLPQWMNQKKGGTSNPPTILDSSAHKEPSETYYADRDRRRKPTGLKYDSPVEFKIPYHSDREEMWGKFKGSGIYYQVKTPKPKAATKAQKQADAAKKAAAETLLDFGLGQSGRILGDVPNVQQPGHHTTAETDGPSQSEPVAGHGRTSISTGFEPMEDRSDTSSGKRQKVSSLPT